MEGRADPLAALTALSEPSRRRLYDHVVAVGNGVTRDQAAAALGIPRSVAAFHLDKLAKVGLLETSYARPPGRGGPGAGRPAKQYRRAAGEVSLSVPARRYELAATLLARAVEQATEGSIEVGEALRRAAREEGRRIASVSPPTAAGTASPLERLIAVLALHGYEPHLVEGMVTLENCPFDALAERHRELVCGMNQALLAGAAEAVGLPACAVRSGTGGGRCCAALVA